ncbi:MAG: DUF1853 family protein [Neisseria sp.]|nr:DUF1853 family protein [Neisseria sp.]
MNYALDALWWRLQTPAVRDLASLLTAPSLWHSKNALSVADLLGETGFRYLLDLDDNPSELLHFLAQTTDGKRLGLYAENLLAFWFTHAPHTRLLAHNLPIQNASGQTLGALDFVVQIKTQIHHVELACKYYGCQTGKLNDFVGLNQEDKFLDKIRKLEQQTSLSQTELAQNALRDLGIAPEQVQTATLTRGMIFVPENTVLPKEVNPLAWRGVYGELQTASAEQIAKWQGQRFYRLPRLAYLAPARVAEDACLSWQEASEQGSGLLAVLEKRVDGYWHEVQRLMLVA